MANAELAMATGVPRGHVVVVEDGVVVDLVDGKATVAGVVLGTPLYLAPEIARLVRFFRALFGWMPGGGAVS